MPKQRNPFLFRDGSNQSSMDRQLDIDISNIERAPINVPTTRIKIDIRKPNKPKPSQIPMRAPAGISTSFPIIFMVSDFLPVSGPSNHYFYSIDSTNQLTLISTQSWPAWGYFEQNTFKRLGNSYYITITNENLQYNDLYRSRDGCLTWESVFQVDEFASHAFCIDAGGRIWIGGYAPSSANTYQSMWYSDDDGDTWTEQSEVFGADGGMDVFSMDAHPTDQNVIVCTGYHYASDRIAVLRTADRGQNWTGSFIAGSGTQYSLFEVKNSIFLPDGRFIVIDGNVITASPPYSVEAYVSDDNGASFSGPYIIQTDNSGESGSDFFSPVMSLHAEGNVVIACFGETPEGGGGPPAVGNKLDSGKIYISLDRGESWTLVTHWPATENWEDINSVFYDADNNRLILITTGAAQPVSDDNGRVFVSSPPGENWTLLLSADIQQIGNAFMTIVR